jgi:uncharacterized RDD family membrane protein YckC
MDQSGSTGGQGSPTPPSGWSPPPAPPAPGPAGLVYADFTTRFIAIFIDGIILAIVDQIVFAILGIVGLKVVSTDINAPLAISYNPIVGILFGLISLAISAGYFVYLWMNRRATLGQQLFKLQVGDAGTGATLTQNQAFRRWIALYGPGALALAVYAFPLLGILILIAAIAWAIFLGYTTAQSPTKQGWHDHFAHTQVVKAVR